MSSYDWMQSDARRRELDRVNAEGRADRTRIGELESQLLDAKRNEERAVDELQSALAMSVVFHEEREAALAKLNTLEAAVRAVREAVCSEVVVEADVMDEMFALVPEVGSKDGGS
jgi:hypothetical protein